MLLRSTSKLRKLPTDNIIASTPTNTNTTENEQRDIFPSFIASEDIDSSDIEQSFREITETCNAIVDSWREQ